MPNPETLMQIWPQEMEDAFNNIELPDGNIDIDISDYVKVILTLMDIP